jgi:hypothetical protein
MRAVCPASRRGGAHPTPPPAALLREGVWDSTDKNIVVVREIGGRPEAVAYLYSRLAVVVAPDGDTLDEQADYLLALVEGSGRVLFDLFGALPEHV